MVHLHGKHMHGIYMSGFACTHQLKNQIKKKREIEYFNQPHKCDNIICMNQTYCILIFQQHLVLNRNLFYVFCMQKILCIHHKISFYTQQWYARFIDFSF